MSVGLSVCKKGLFMVNEEIVNETIKRMLDTGIDEETIISTLNDIGIDAAQAKKMIESQKSPAKEEDDIDKVDLDEQAKRIRSMQNEYESQSKTQQLHETTTHNMLGAHADKLDELHKKIDEVKQTVSVKGNDSSLTVKLSSLEEKVSELKAQSDALLSIMKDILEANRKILTELESKK